MHKVISFNSEIDKHAAQDFLMLYSIFVGASNNPNKASSIEETRNAIQVLDAFDAVSHIFEENDQEFRRLKDEGGDMELTDGPYRLLSKFVDQWVTTAPVAVARQAMRIKDRVDMAQPKASKTDDAKPAAKGKAGK